MRLLIFSIRYFSFHVGSGCYDAKAFRHAVKDVRKVFDMAPAFGFDLSIIDVGGGFPGTENAKITIHEVSCHSLSLSHPPLSALFLLSLSALRVYLNDELTVTDRSINCHD